MKINPCSMTDWQAKVFSEFLLTYSDPIMEPIKYTIKMNGEEISFKLTHRVIYRSRIGLDPQKTGYRYEVLDPHPLGSGGFGTIYRIIMTFSFETGKLVPIYNGKHRVVKIQEKATGKTESKYSFHALHLHAKPCIFDEKKEKSYMVLREMPGENLQKILAENKLTFGEKLQLAFQLINAYQEQVYNPGFVHLDLKPGNIMVDLKSRKSNHGITSKNPLPNVNIIDFGLAKWQMERDKKCAGSLNYMAPEVLTGKGSYIASDIYGLGRILICLFTDEKVFSRKEKKHLDNLFKKVMKDKVVTQAELVWRAKLGLDKMKLDGVPLDIKEKLIDTISRMVEVDLAKRISFDLCLQEIQKTQTLHNEFLMRVTPILPKQEKLKQSINSIKGMKNIFFSCLLAQQPQVSGRLQRPRPHG